MLKRVCLLMAMIWSLGFICTADAAPMELGLKPVVLGNEYSISLFMDDKVLRNPMRHDRIFGNKPGIEAFRGTGFGFVVFVFADNPAGYFDNDSFSEWNPCGKPQTCSRWCF